MSRFKTVDDLDAKNPASLGGAMGTWPYRTLWYLCRWERTGQTDPNVVEALSDANVDALRDLGSVAGRNGIGTSTLDARRRALEESDPADMRNALARAYRNQFDGGRTCPYEQEGRDMACHKCPVAASALANLGEDL